MDGSSFDLCHGAHICSIYRYFFEQLVVTVRYVSEGLKAGEKCVILTDQNTKQQFLNSFKKGGVETGSLLQSGKLQFFDNTEVYMQNGYFDAERTLKLLKEVESKALADGYSQVRFVGELPFTDGVSIDGKEACAYEIKANEHLQSSHARAMCHYNETRYDKDFLANILNAHECVAIYGNGYRNNRPKNAETESYKHIINRLIEEKALTSK